MSSNARCFDSLRALAVPTEAKGLVWGRVERHGRRGRRARWRHRGHSLCLAGSGQGCSLRPRR